MRGSLIEVARNRALREGCERAYLFLSDGEGDAVELDRAELDRRARRVAAELQERFGPATVGLRVLVFCPHGLDFVVGFLGCLYAGAIAVPTEPPRRHRVLERTAVLVRDSGASAVLTVASVRDEREALALRIPELAGLAWIAVDELAVGREQGFDERRPSADEIAFLQYTSGSTGTPRGVEVRHGNLVHNLALLRDALLLGPDSVMVSWLPLHHDMGLIGMVLESLFVGAPCVMLSPAHFLARPARWLEAVTRYRATTTGGPNFAYDLCVDRISEVERAGLDLSSLTRAFNGAEPVRSTTLDRFARAFAPAGLSRRALYPGYGLAEATLVVSGGDAHEGPVELDVDRRELDAGTAVAPADEAATKRLVGSGRVLGDLEVAVVDPEHRVRRGERAVGEIWVRGASVARGFWNQPEASVATFGATIHGGDGAPFLRTGDLGFLDAGELYVTGRLKDLLVLRGENHAPQDIELTAEQSHADLRAGGSAAFPIEVRGEERLALAVELTRRLSEPAEVVTAAIRRAVAAEHGVEVEALALIRPGSLLRTTSGKVRRRAMREAFQADELAVVAAWRASGDPREALRRIAAPAVRSPQALESWLARLVGAVLEAEPAEVDPEASLGALGLDSLRVVEIAHRVEDELSRELPLVRLFEGASLRAIAAELARAVAEPPESGADEARERASEDGDSPQSHGQRALWFLRRLEPASSAYHLTLGFRVPTELDLEALRRALATVAARHPALRTTFFETPDGVPSQRVHAELPLLFDRPDVVGGVGGHDVESRMAREATRPFDLESAPPLRVVVHEQAGRVLALQLVAHHIALDHWSFAVLVAELSEAYRCELEGDVPALPPAPPHRAEGAPDEAAAARDASFWRAKLESAPELELALDARRPAEPAHRGATLRADLGRELTAQVRELARARDTTPFVVCLAAFELALHAETGQTDFVFGTLGSGRERAERSGVLGYFVDPFVLRADLAGAPTFLEVLERARRDVATSLAHRSLSFSELVLRLSPTRAAGRNPYFQVLFAWQHPLRHAGLDLAPFALGAAGARLALGPHELVSLELEDVPAPFDLSWTLAEVEREGETSLALALEYDRELFEPATAERLAARYRRILERTVLAPERALASLVAPDEDELSALARLWDGPPPRPAAQRPLIELLWERVDAAPDAVAIVDAARTITYGELGARAARLARTLASSGVCPGTLVAISAPRSIELCVALFAVLETGGAWLLLDERLPELRRRRLVEDAGAVLHLCVAGEERAVPEGLGGLGGLGGLQPLLLDETDAPPAPAAARRAPRRESGGDVAYLIYTSGSTGSPKGVVIPESALCAHTVAATDHFGLTPDDRVLHMASIGFDLSVEEVFPTLLAGARLVIRSAAAPPSADELVELVEREGLTVLDLPTAYWHEWVRALEAQGLAVPRCLRVVIVGGERVSADAYRAWCALDTDHVAWFNTYGPTEATVTTTLYRPAREGELREGASIPIGRPVAGWRAGVIDGRGRPAPVGVPGEIVIGGVGLARGYHGSPASTAERFVPDPLLAGPPESLAVRLEARAGQAGARVFRTGDRGRFRNDGRLEFLGRRDDQVKVRGFRVEPAEAESALAAHPDVTAAAVVAARDPQGRMQLVAYAVPRAGRELDPGRVRADLSAALPGYLVPSVLTAVSALPLSASGKLDRSALPAPDWHRDGTAGGGPDREPRGDVEATLAGILGTTLGRASVGRHDDFFELGGDSIQSIQVAARAAQAGLALTPSDLFQRRTVAELARGLARARPAAPSRPEPPRAGPVPLTPIQRWFFDQSFVEPAHWNQGLVLETENAPEPAVLEQALALLVARHDALRLRFRRSGDAWRARVVLDPERALAVRSVDLADLPRDERPVALERACAELQTGFDLERGPLLAALVVRLEPGRTRLVLCAHHLVVDAVSWRILVDELEGVLDALERGAPVELPPVPIPWSTWARDGAHPGEIAPTRDARACGTVRDEGRVEVALDGAGTRSSIAAANRLHAGLDELLVAALARVLAGGDGGRREVVVDVEGHGRDATGRDLSRTVGWFTTMGSVSLELDPREAPEEALRAAKRALRSSGTPDVVGGGRAASAPVLFNFLGRLDGALGRSGRFRLRDEPPGPTRAGSATRSHPFEIDAWILGGGLRMRWSYARTAHDEAHVRSLAEGLLSELTELCEPSRATPQALDPSDFPLVKLSPRQLEGIVGRIAADTRPGP